jgi:magnesium-transporting ATPase (P-type)
VPAFKRVREIPFTSERKMMSSIEVDHEQGAGRVLVAKGAPEVLLGRCNRGRQGMDVVPLDDGWRRILADVDSLSDAALRTLAVAYRPLEAGEDRAPDEALDGAQAPAAGRTRDRRAHVGRRARSGRRDGCGDLVRHRLVPAGRLH